jgi:hypothetical protein
MSCRQVTRKRKSKEICTKAEKKSRVLKKKSLRYYLCNKKSLENHPKSLTYTLGGANWKALRQSVIGSTFEEEKFILKICSTDETSQRIKMQSSFAWCPIEVVVFSQKVSEKHIDVLRTSTTIYIKDIIFIILSYFETDYIESIVTCSDYPLKFDCSKILQSPLQVTEKLRSMIDVLWILRYGLCYPTVSNAITSVVLDPLFIHPSNLRSMGDLCPSTLIKKHRNCRTLGEYFARQMPVYNGFTTYIGTIMGNESIVSIISKSFKNGGFFNCSHEDFHGEWTIGFFETMQAGGHLSQRLDKKLNRLFDFCRKDNLIGLKSDHILVKQILRDAERGFTDEPYPTWNDACDDYIYNNSKIEA